MAIISIPNHMYLAQAMESVANFRIFRPPELPTHREGAQICQTVSQVRGRTVSGMGPRKDLVESEPQDLVVG